MKIETSLLLACLAIIGIVGSIDAETIKNASANEASTREKNLEVILRNSGLCKRYPIAVKISNENAAFISTYGDRQLSDRETKLLALRMARLALNNVKEIVEVKVRLYDLDSTRYWKDIALSTTQIVDDLNSTPGQEQILNSIKIVNNLGLVDGKNLESRVELYKQILKLKQAGVDVRSFLLQFAQIEKAEKDRQNIDHQVAELNALLIATEPTAGPTVKPISSNKKTNDEVGPLEQELQKARDDETAAEKAMEAVEQERSDLPPPRANDSDSQARYENSLEGIERRIDAARTALQEAHRYRELISKQLMQAREHN